MIISHKHKFIFLKTKKTAGTSVEISLSRYCGENDIITPISIQDEAVRYLLGQKPQNYINIKYYYNHITAEEMKKKIGENIWNSYYKFAFERNPFDRAISLYFFQTKSLSMENFDNWLKKTYISSPHNNNFDIYTIDGKMAVDFLGRYENLSSNLAYICDKINLKFDGWLPKAKGFYRKNKLPYWKVLNDEQIEIISRLNQDTMNLFKDYTFRVNEKGNKLNQTTIDLSKKIEYEKRAIEFLNRGKIDEFLMNSYMAIGLDFENSWCYWYTLGNLLKKRSNYSRAIDAYKKAVLLNPNFSWCWYHLGDCLEKIGKNQDSVDSFVKATELYPQLRVFKDRLIKVKKNIKF